MNKLGYYIKFDNEFLEIRILPILSLKCSKMKTSGTLKSRSHVFLHLRSNLATRSKIIIFNIFQSQPPWLNDYVVRHDAVFKLSYLHP